MLPIPSWLMRIPTIASIYLCVLFMYWEDVGEEKVHCEPGLTIILHAYWGYCTKLLKQSTTLKQEPYIVGNCS